MDKIQIFQPDTNWIERNYKKASKIEPFAINITIFSKKYACIILLKGIFETKIKIFAPFKAKKVSKKCWIASTKAHITKYGD